MKDKQQIFSPKLEAFLKKKRVYRKALKNTVRYIKKNSDIYDQQPIDNLICCFVFVDTEEDYTYWMKLYKKSIEEWRK